MKLFVGKNCMPCKMLKQWLVDNKIEIPQLIAEDNMQEAQAAGVKALPTLVLDDGSTLQGFDNIKEYFAGEEDE